MTHLSDDEIERLLTTRLRPAEKQKVARHLLAGCGVCSRELIAQAPGRLLDEAEESRGGRASRDPLRNRTIAAAQEQETHRRIDEKKLQRSLELLSTHPQGHDGLTFQQIQPLHGKPRVEILLQRSWELRFRDPRMMRWLAYNAVKAAESLRREEHAPAILLDLQALAWGELTNAYRVNDQYGEAEAAMRKARSFLRRGSGDLQLLARVAEVEATLRAESGRRTEASILYANISKIYRKLGKRHLVGKTLISSGINTFESGAPRQAIQILREGLLLLDPDRDEQAVAAGHQSMVFILASSGQHRDAGQMLLRSGLRLSFSRDPLGILRVRWAEGKIQAGLGNLSRSIKALFDVHAEFLDVGQKSTAAIVGLDLLPILMQQGKHALVRKTALESYATLLNLGIRRGAAKARRYL
jgi:tetratricopeptide (TPR) repeat protein